MTSEKKGKSSSVTVISIFFIFTALIVFLHALLNFNIRPIVKIFEIMRTMELEVPVFLLILISPARHALMISSLETAFSVFIIYSAVEFLRLKNWARIALTTIAFVEIVLFLGHLGFWAIMVHLLPVVTATLLNFRSSEALTSSLTVYAGSVFLFLILPLTASAIFLQKKGIRSVML